MKLDVNEPQVAKALDVVANNIYHGTQDHFDGAWQAEQWDFARSLKRTNFLVTETNAQTLGWDSASQFPPYDGQMRLDVYTYLSSGANMVEYWHWHSIHAGQETYWKGVLSHDLEPNRAYAEVSPAPPMSYRRSAPSSSTSRSRTRSPSSTASIPPTASASCPIDRDQPSGWTPGKSGDSYGDLIVQLHKLALQRQRRRRFPLRRLTGSCPAIRTVQVAHRSGALYLDRRRCSRPSPTM